MKGNAIPLLIFGLLFPAISLLTGVASLAIHRLHKKHSSPVFIPFIGPILLTVWVIRTGNPIWIVPIVWCCDVGTVAFLVACPYLIRDWWRTSTFTTTLTLRGTHEGSSVVITLHSTGHYLLRKTWKRAAGETGIIDLGEPGIYKEAPDGYFLTAHHGLQRVLRKTTAGTFTVEEVPLPEAESTNSTIDRWTLRT